MAIQKNPTCYRVNSKHFNDLCQASQGLSGLCLLISPPEDTMLLHGPLAAVLLIVP